MGRRSDCKKGRPVLHKGLHRVYRTVGNICMLQSDRGVCLAHTNVTSSPLQSTQHSLCNTGRPFLRPLLDYVNREECGVEFFGKALFILGEMWYTQCVNALNSGSLNQPRRVFECEAGENASRRGAGKTGAEL